MQLLMAERRESLSVWKGTGYDRYLSPRRYAIYLTRKIVQEIDRLPIPVLPGIIYTRSKKSDDQNTTKYQVSALRAGFIRGGIAP